MFFRVSAGDISLPWDCIFLPEAVPIKTSDGRRAAVGRSFRDVEAARGEQYFLTGQQGYRNRQASWPADFDVLVQSVDVQDG
jgi:hypothetical protein